MKLFLDYWEETYFIYEMRNADCKLLRRLEFQFVKKHRPYIVAARSSAHFDETRQFIEQQMLVHYYVKMVLFKIRRKE